MKAIRIKLGVVLTAACLWLGMNQSSALLLLYQGRLNENSIPANGLYDMEIRFFGSSTNGTALASLFCLAERVDGGLFTLNLSLTDALAADIFNGEARWLEVGVRPQGGASFTTLSPRQPIGDAPYAFHAGTAASVKWSGITDVPQSGLQPLAAGQGLVLNPLNGTNLLGINIASASPGQVLTYDGSLVGWLDPVVRTGSVTTASLVNGSVTAEKIPQGTLLKSLNGLHDDVVLSVKGGLKLNAIGNLLELEGPIGGDGGDCDTYASCFWSLLGNAGTDPLFNFVGTTDNKPLEMKVWNHRALRLEPGIAPDFTPNFIAGRDDNDVAAGIYGAAIGGGLANRITAQQSTIGGGQLNVASGAQATIGGGDQNVAGGDRSTVGGGYFNRATTVATTTSGGWNNAATNNFSTVVGGADNVAGGLAAVVGGFNNVALGIFSTVGGGSRNFAAERGSSIGGGEGNGNYGGYSAISGGLGNVISNAGYATLGAGYGNFIGGVNSIAATVAGGQVNTNWANAATIGGGLANIAAGDKSTIAGGWENSASGEYATIGGGYLNSTYARGAVVAGGGGFPQGGNKAIGPWSSIVGGYNNVASNLNSFIGGGADNRAFGSYSAIPGGRDNGTEGNDSFAGGRQAYAKHDGTFVWNDGSDGTFSSSANQQFLVHAAGGVGINVNSPVPNGLSIKSPGSALELKEGDLKVTDAGVNTHTIVFTHRAEASSISGHVTTISNPRTDARPDAILLVTHNWSKDTASDRYEKHTVGVFYEGGKWKIFHEDLTAMPEGRAFNVMVINP